MIVRSTDHIPGPSASWWGARMARGAAPFPCRRLIGLRVNRQESYPEAGNLFPKSRPWAYIRARRVGAIYGRLRREYLSNNEEEISVSHCHKNIPGSPRRERGRAPLCFRHGESRPWFGLVAVHLFCCGQTDLWVIADHAVDIPLQARQVDQIAIVVVRHMLFVLFCKGRYIGSISADPAG